MIFRACKVLAVFSAFFLSAASVLAQEKDKPALFRKGLLFESKIENPKVFSDIEGAKKTLLVPAYEWEYGVRVFTKETWKAQGKTWADYYANAAAIADSIIDTLEPEWGKDHRGVINYVILQSEDPFLSSVLISTKLHAKFKETLGENIHLVIPERGTIYLFPAEGGKLDGYGPALIARFNQSPSPVSTEVFLLTKSGYKVIGELEE